MNLTQQDDRVGADPRVCGQEVVDGLLCAAFRLAADNPMRKIRYRIELLETEDFAPVSTGSGQHYLQGSTVVILGLGVDIVEVERIEQALARGNSMAQRVFTEAELTYCMDRKNRYQHFAGRFAAKEAALKALGTGWQEGIRWKDVEVVPGELGRPVLNFYGRAREIFEARQARSALVTITHATRYAVAAVVIEG